MKTSTKIQIANPRQIAELVAFIATGVLDRQWVESVLLQVKNVETQTGLEKAIACAEDGGDIRELWTSLYGTDIASEIEKLRVSFMHRERVLQPALSDLGSRLDAVLPWKRCESYSCIGFNDREGRALFDSRKRMEMIEMPDGISAPASGPTDLPDAVFHRGLMQNIILHNERMFRNMTRWHRLSGAPWCYYRRFVPGAFYNAIHAFVAALIARDLVYADRIRPLIELLVEGNVPLCVNEQRQLIVLVDKDVSN